MAVHATTTTPLYIYFITGNQYKLLNRAFYYDLRKYYFSARVVNIWNSLPNYVVDVSTIM